MHEKRVHIDIPFLVRIETVMMLGNALTVNSDISRKLLITY